MIVALAVTGIAICWLVVTATIVIELRRWGDCPATLNNQPDSGE